MTEEAKPLSDIEDFLAKSVDEQAAVLEQQVLGTLLSFNSVYHDISDELSPDDFVEPFHGMLYSVIGNEILAGRQANPYTLKSALEEYDTEEFSAKRYMTRLFVTNGKATGTLNTVRHLKDLSVRRELKSVGEAIISCSNDHPCNIETDKIIERAEAELYEKGSHKIKQEWQPLGAAASETLAMAAEAMSSDEKLAGLSTGIKAIDRLLGGLQKGNLILLAARPSMGKTALGLNIAHNVAKKGAPVAFFSMEMSSEELSTRILSSTVKITGERIRRGNIDSNDFTRITDASRRADSLPLFIDDSGGLSIAQIVSRARRLWRREGVKLIVLDYIQLAHGDTRRKDSRVLEIGEISMGLKSLAKELKIPIIALSQLSRDLERRPDKRPELADLRDSGTLEQDADVVLFLYREEYYLARKEPHAHEIEKLATWNERMEKLAGKADLIAAKQRHGPTGVANLHFDGEHTLFQDPSRVKAFGSW